MPDPLDEARYQLAIANRIIAHEGVLDAFGHVSMRHPGDPGRYLLARSRSPELIEPADIYEFTLDSEPVRPAEVTFYAERVIHGCIYQARPDVNAVCHHHSPAVLPFCATGTQLVAVFHLGAMIGGVVPFWDSRDEFGDTNMLVIKPEEGRSLARALGAALDGADAPAWRDACRHHAAGAGVPHGLFPCNAEIQLRATMLGKIEPLSRGEAELTGPISCSRARWGGRGNTGRRGSPRRVRCRAAPARAINDRGGQRGRNPRGDPGWNPRSGTPESTTPRAPFMRSARFACGVVLS